MPLERYPLNLWYQAGWSEEVADGGSLARTIGEIPILFYRKSDSNLAAVHDRCPHRFAALSQGCIDKAAVLARRKLQKLIVAESGDR